MARYNGPVCRLCRREGMKLFLKGARCYTKKCAFERRPSPPGQHGIRRRKRTPFQNAAETMSAAQVPDWVHVEPDKLRGTIAYPPRRDQMPAELNEQLVVEYYSR
jgi:ribosomal protein S4